MKKKYNRLSAFLAVAVLLLGACTHKEDAILSESANDRIESSLAEYQAILLTGSPLWELNYQTKSGEEFTFLIRFKENNRVEMRSDFSIEPQESSWKMTAEESILLSFDTYSLIHVLADPGIGGDKGKGYEGDFEFVLNGYDKDQEVHLIGRKHKAELSLKRVPETAIAELEEAVAIYDQLFSPEASLFRVLQDGSGNSIATLFFNSGSRTICYYYTNEQGEFVRKDNIQVKVAGKTIRFKEELVVNAHSISSCEFVDEQTLKVDENLSFVLSNIPTTYQGAYDTCYGSNAYMKTASSMITELLDQMKELKSHITGIQFYWALSKGRPALTITARGPLGSTMWYNMFGDGDQLKAGEDILSFVYLRTYGWSGKEATREEAREIMGMSQTTELLRLFNEDGLGTSIIPAQDPKQFYLVSRANPKVWILFNFM